MGRNKKIIIGLLALIGVGIALRYYFGGDQTTVQAYRLVEVGKGEIVRIVSSTGTINPLNTVNVGSQISGNIKEIFVDFNSIVTKNQVIALIDNSVYAAQVEQARAKLLIAKTQHQEREKDVLAAEAAVRSAEASLFSARAALKLATSQYSRQKNLQARKAATQAELDMAESGLNTAVGSVKIAEAKVQSTMAQHQRSISQVKGAAANIVDKNAARHLAMIQLKYCKIISPINGIVIHRNVDVGQTVASTLQSPTLFSIAEDLSRMQLEVDVSESDVGLVKQNQLVSFTVDAFPDNKFKAVVHQIRNQPTSVQNVVTYKIIASVKNDKLLLRPGMTANVSIEVARVDDVLKVPNAALRFKPSDEAAASQPKAGGRQKGQMLKRLTKQLDLNENQASSLEKIIQTEGKQLQAIAKTEESAEVKKKAYREFMRKVVTQLYPLLSPEQATKMNELITKWRKTASQRSGEQKPGTVYAVDDQGNPLLVKVLSGVSNETETQILSQQLKAGDKVIIGIDYNAASKKSEASSNPFMPKRRRR
jgi:HlyD family secretion protein